jgi:hypothetical protein
MPLEVRMGKRNCQYTVSIARFALAGLPSTWNPIFDRSLGITSRTQGNGVNP